MNEFYNEINGKIIKEFIECDECDELIDFLIK